MKATNISRKKRLFKMLIITFFVGSLLIIRIGFLQFIQGKDLMEKAYEQQTLNRKINPKRGTIFDSKRRNSFSY